MDSEIRISFLLAIDVNKFGYFIFLMLLTDCWFITSTPCVLTDDLNILLAFSPPLPVSIHIDIPGIMLFILLAVRHTPTDFSQDIWAPDIFRKIATKSQCTFITDIWLMWDGQRLLWEYWIGLIAIGLYPGFFFSWLVYKSKCIARLEKRLLYVSRSPPGFGWRVRLALVARSYKIWWSSSCFLEREWGQAGWDSYKHQVTPSITYTLFYNT